MSNIESVKEFKGNPFYTFRVWFTWGIALALAGYVTSRLIAVGDIADLNCFFLWKCYLDVLFQADSQPPYYSNHQCFWYRKKFDLREISNIEVVSDGNTGIATNWLGYRRGWPIALRIYLSPEYPSAFYACTLNNKQWEMLEAAFRG